MLRPAKCETGHKNICTVFKGVRFPVYDLLLCAIIEQLHLRVSKLEFIVATFTNYYGALPVGGVTAGCSTLSVCLSVVRLATESENPGKTKFTRKNANVTSGLTCSPVSSRKDQRSRNPQTRNIP